MRDRDGTVVISPSLYGGSVINILTGFVLTC